MGTDDIALFDIDGTLADYDGALLSALNRIRSPYEPELNELDRDKEPEYIMKRMVGDTSKISIGMGHFGACKRFRI